MKRLKPKQRVRMAAKAAAGPRQRLRLVSDGGSDVSLGSSLDALLAIRVNDLVSATRILNQLRRDGLDDDYCRQARALLCAARGDYPGVVQYLEGVHHDELFPGLRTLLGFAYFQLKDFDAAVPVLEAALDENPEDEKANEYLQLARAELQADTAAASDPPYRMRLILTPEECAAIAEAFPSLTYVGTSLVTERGQAVPGSYMNARVAAVDIAHPAMAAACAKMLAAVKDCAAEFGQTEVLVITEARINRYGEGEQITWHHDRGVPHPDKRISITVQLTSPRNYEGGVLQIACDGASHAAPRDQGAAVIFPSDRMHRVTPITRGERAALIVFAGLARASAEPAGQA